MLANLFTRIARWFSKREPALYEHEAFGMGDPFVMTQARIQQIEARQHQLRAMIDGAVKRKAKRSHLQAEMTKLTTERLSLERLWSCG